MLKIRNAQIKDSHSVWTWRNNLESRSNFKNSKVILKKDHDNWYKKLINSKIHYAFIIEYKKQKIGIVRYNFNVKKNIFIVSVNMNPKHRNKGFGKEILLLGDNKIRNSLNYNINLIAEVKNENIKSNRIFNNAGYKKIGRKKNYSIYNKILEGDMKKKNTNHSHEYYLKIIDDIQSIRSKNNINWMDLLRIAFKHDPKQASIVMSKIYKDDQKISKLAKKLTKKK